MATSPASFGSSIPIEGLKAIWLELDDVSSENVLLFPLPTYHLFDELLQRKNRTKSISHCCQSIIRSYDCFEMLQGFRKIDPDRWEFANEGFLGGQKHLLKTIKRRRNVSQCVQQKGGPCLELGQYGLGGEVERLARDCSLLTAEVVKLRQQQQSSREQVMTLQSRLQATERKQQQMMVFLAKALANPLFVRNLMHQRKEMRGIEVGRKRRLTASSTEENMEAHVFAAPMGVTEIEPTIETLFSTAVDSDLTSEITVSEEVPISLTKSVDVPNVNDEINWEQLLQEDFIGEAEDDVSALGVDLSDVDLDWTEDLQTLADQMDFPG